MYHYASLQLDTVSQKSFLVLPCLTQKVEPIVFVVRFLIHNTIFRVNVSDTFCFSRSTPFVLFIPIDGNLHFSRFITFNNGLLKDIKKRLMRLLMSIIVTYCVCVLCVVSGQTSGKGINHLDQVCRSIPDLSIHVDVMQDDIQKCKCCVMY